MSDELEWKSPPVASKGRTRDREKWTGTVAALKARRGEWAVIQKHSHSALTSAINSGRIEAFRPAGTFEATARKVSDGRYDIYARYVGEVSA